jgi:RNA polymerase sigma-70 factor, ECF subfamily
MEQELLPNFMMMVGHDDGPENSLPTVRSLIARAKLGESEAFEEIMIRYQRQVIGTAMKLLANLDDARDAGQEVFLRLHKYLYSFNEERELAPWLYQLTINVCREIARKRRSNTTRSLEQEYESGALDSLASNHDIEGEMRVAQERKIILAAIDSLPEKERAAIVLRDIEGLDTSDVARILGSSETTVRSQISMARVKIKKFRDRLLKKS